MIFDLVDNEPKITIEGIHIPELKEVWEADETPEKLRASQLLPYIYHMSDYKSVYAKLETETRKKQVEEDYLKLPLNEQEQAMVDAAIEKYMQLQETPAMRLLNGAEHAMNKLTQYFYTVDFTERDMQGRPVHSAKDVTANIDKLGKIVISLRELRKEVEREQATTKKIRRNVVPSQIL